MTDINAVDFGLDNGGTTDNTAAFQNLRDYAASLMASGSQAQVVFPAGDYAATVFPNWDIPGLVVKALGKVLWTNVGVGDTVRIDAGLTGGVPNKISNVYFGVGGGQLIARGGPSSGHGFYVRGLVRGDVRGRVWGCGTANKAGLLTHGPVLVNFEVAVTNDESGGWYLGGKPQYGYFLTGHAGIPDSQTSYCHFPNMAVTSCAVGVYLDSTLGNVFTGGASEHNTDVGIHLSPQAIGNKFFGTDMEVNTNRDLYCVGVGNEFHGVDTEKLVVIGGKANQIVGGNHSAIYVDVSAQYSLVSGVRYNRGLNGAALTNNSPTSRVVNSLNMQSGWHV